MMFVLTCWLMMLLVLPVSAITSSTKQIKVKNKDYQQNQLADPVAVGGSYSSGYNGYPSYVENPRPTRLLTDEQRLLRHLMTDYDPHTRPVLNASHPVNVKVGITLNQIFDLDERNQVLTSHIWFDQEWDDEQLKWDPGDYNELKTLRVPCHLIWKPDIVLYNSADDYINGYMPALAMVSHNGHVFWPPIVRLRSTCKIDITYFPFDDQTCSLKMGSWAYDGLQVDIHKREKPIDLENYVSNGEWELINVKVTRNVAYYSCCPEPYPDVNFTLHIRRRTLYYTYNVIIPCIMLSGLTVLGFWIPPEGGEKVGLGLTILLAYSVFMLLIAENMPATSFYIPLIGVYIIVAMGLTCVTVVFSVTVSYIHHQGNMSRPVPDYLRATARTLKYCFRMFHKNKTKLSSSAPSTERTPSSTTDTTPDVKTPLRQSFCASSSVNFTHHTCKNCHHCVEYDTLPATGAGSSLHRVKTSNQNDVLRNHGSCVTVASSGEDRSTVTIATATGSTLRRNPTLHAEYNAATASVTAHAHTRKKGEARRASQDELAKKLDLVLLKQEEIIKLKDDSINREWHELAEVIDRGLFWVYLVVLVSITVVILLIIPLGKRVDI